MKRKVALIALTVLLSCWLTNAEDAGKWIPKSENQTKADTLYQLVEMAEKWTQKQMNPSVLIWPPASGLVVSEWTTDGGLRIADPFKAKNKNGYVRPAVQWVDSDGNELHVVHCYIWVKYSDVTCSITNEDKAL